MKKIIFLMLLFPLLGISQQQSEPSKFINESLSVQINKNENAKAVFKSGVGETVTFYPSEIIDLKEKKRIEGLELESIFITREYQNRPSQYTKETAWIETAEIPELLFWFENYIIPNMNLGANSKKTVQYVFNSKEVQFKFDINNSGQTFTIIIKNSKYEDKYFWTETRVKDIPNIIKTLQYFTVKT
ncbi:hypothetical protein [Flavobacterium foetidum]|uniref:hypothetical protein n=1 Tax=Flavobacterium foetidum TaxID=2026681 RepID=UPI001074A608|nr:hypothetical protein [Flavobacterium foetidum]KAF2508830.1 hypothetical protein E0W73_19490 [Flavobacterium foetidum]